MNQSRLIYEFDSYRVDVANRLVLRHEDPLPLTPKAVEILVALIARRGEIISKSELMKTVWPDTAVEDSNLAQNVYLLRKILNSEASGRHYVETFPRRGYRFMGEVREIRNGNQDLSHGHNEIIREEPFRQSSNETPPIPREHFELTKLNRGEHWLKSYGVFSLAGVLVAGFVIAFLVINARNRQSKSVNGAPAEQSYLKGRQFWTKGTTPALEESIQYFNESIRYDEKYAPAYAGLADSYIALSERYDMDRHDNDALAKALTAASQAIRLDEHLAEGHVAMAIIQQQNEWNWKTAEAEFTHAIVLNPNYAYAHQRYAFLLAALGRSAEAKAEITDALRLDPNSTSINADAAQILWFGGEYQASITQWLKAIEIDPSQPMAPLLHRWLGLSYEERGMHEQAAAEFIESLRLQNGSPERISALRQAYDTGGIKGYWLKWLEFREQRIKLGGINPWNVAQVYALVGDNDRAFEQLHKACDEHSLPVAALRFGPTFKNLRSDPRYLAILKRVKLNS
jgi:DNA-binding winged helix-turn-helix (wHTH) protein/tetratricopeptide (TPR) repeat protein